MYYMPLHSVQTRTPYTVYGAQTLHAVHVPTLCTGAHTMHYMRVGCL